MKKFSLLVFLMALLSLNVSCSSRGEQYEGAFDAQEEQANDEIGLEEEEARDEIYAEPYGEAEEQEDMSW